MRRDADLLRRRAAIDQRVAHGAGTRHRQLEVLLGLAARVGEAVQLDFQLRVRAEQLTEIRDLLKKS